MMTNEQRIRVQNFIPGFHKYILEGTINHCRRLYNSGMVYEACEILGDFTGKEQTECLKILED